VHLTILINLISGGMKYSTVGCPKFIVTKPIYVNQATATGSAALQTCISCVRRRMKIFYYVTGTET